MNKFPSISFEEGLIRSEYGNESKKKAKLFICENIDKYKDKSEVYLTNGFNKNIFVIKHTLNIIWKDKNYPIYLLIYLPIKFPKELRIYINKVTNLEINQNYLNKNIIDFSTLELYYQNLIQFQPLEDPISFLIENIYNKFSNEFPLYKAEKEQHFFGPCYLNEAKTFLINIKPDDLKPYNSIESMRKKITQTILNLINNKSFEIQQASSELEAIEKNITQEIDSSNSKNSKNKENIELEEIVTKLKDMELKLESEVYYLKNNKERRVLDICHEIVNIKDEEKYKYTVMKKTIEDYLLYIKKGMEKKLIPFNICVDRTRKLSKELFYIMFAIEKRNNIHN